MHRCLAESAERFGWRVHAYVVMSNHFHLALETPEPNLSEAMKWLQGTWAARFNRFRGETGRPFQGRYKALHVEPGEALAQVAHYIHLNPVRAGILTAGRLPEYRYSSLPRFLRSDCPAWLVADMVLAESGGLADSPEGWKCYVEYLGFLAEEDAARRNDRFGRLSRGWAIGSAEFKRDLREELAPPAAGRGWLRLLLELIGKRNGRPAPPSGKRRCRPWPGHSGSISPGFRPRNQLLTRCDWRP